MDNALNQAHEDLNKALRDLLDAFKELNAANRICVEKMEELTDMFHTI